MYGSGNISITKTDINSENKSKIIIAKTISEEIMIKLKSS